MVGDMSKRVARNKQIRLSNQISEARGCMNHQTSPETAKETKRFGLTLSRGRLARQNQNAEKNENRELHCINGISSYDKDIAKEIEVLSGTISRQTDKSTSAKPKQFKTQEVVELYYKMKS